MLHTRRSAPFGFVAMTVPGTSCGGFLRLYGVKPLPRVARQARLPSQFDNPTAPSRSSSCRRSARDRTTSSPGQDEPRVLGAQDHVRRHAARPLELDRTGGRLLVHGERRAPVGVALEPDQGLRSSAVGCQERAAESSCTLIDGCKREAFAPTSRRCRSPRASDKRSRCQQNIAVYDFFQEHRCFGCSRGSFSPESAC